MTETGFEARAMNDPANTNEVMVSTWQECQAKVAEIEMANATSPTKLLFRGQCNSSWRLDTTLERRVQAGVSFIEYYRTILRVAPEISAYFGASWALPSYKDITDLSKNYDQFSLLELPAYDYLVYLRHHGFPSPLLDWSRSLYVAAYFALPGADEERTLAVGSLRKQEGLPETAAARADYLVVDAVPRNRSPPI